MTEPREQAVLVLDIGTSGLRTAIVDHSGHIVDYDYVGNPPSTPFAGLVEFDALDMYDKSVASMQRIVDRNPTVRIASLGITNQRASTIAWDAATGLPVGPALGWQDLRTVMECITAKTEHAIHLAPNQSATKAAWLMQNSVANAGTPPGRIRIGTIDAWLTWKLTAGAVFVTDHTNAAVTGLVTVDALAWDAHICGTLGVPVDALPLIVATSEVVGAIVGHDVLEGISLAARVGDQQASLVGQGCIDPGDTKITFGTGGMLDMVTGRIGPSEARRTSHGTFPIVAYSQPSNVSNVAATEYDVVWGIEAVMLSAGTNIEWLCTDMGLIATPADSDALASSVSSTDGVAFVPALLGLGTPEWDYGARGTLTGLTRGTTSAHIVRAVLDGIAQRGADLLAAASADSAERNIAPSPRIRIDGGMSRNHTFVALLSEATGRSIEVSPVTEATTLGAAFLAGVASGVWATLSDAAATWHPASIVAPHSTSNERGLARQEWSRTLAAARAWIPALSALDF